MEEMGGWGALLFGAAVVLLIVWLRPGLRAVWQQSAAAQERDWKGVLIPIGMVVLFVILLIVMARGG